MKWCPRCKKNKPISLFGKRKPNRFVKKPFRQSYCIICLRVYRKQWELKNKDAHRAIIRRTRTRRKQVCRTELVRFLKEHSCVDCGESDIVVLTFDHIRGKKSFNIYQGVSRRGWRMVLKEIKKCDVVCANCHYRRTAKTQRWMKREI